MGKAGQSYMAPTYQMPTYTAPTYEGPSEMERQARIDALKQQWDKEAVLNKEIKAVDVKREELEDTKEELESRQGVTDVLSSGQKGFKRKTQTTLPDDAILNQATDEELASFLGAI